MAKLELEPTIPPRSDIHGLDLSMVRRYQAECVQASADAETRAAANARAGNSVSLAWGTVAVVAAALLATALFAGGVMTGNANAAKVETPVPTLIVPVPATPPRAEPSYPVWPRLPMRRLPVPMDEDLART